MRWSGLIALAAAVLAGAAAQAEEWARLETGDRATRWGINPSSIRTEAYGPTRAWFIRAIPPVGEDSPDYRLSLEAFDCERYVRLTETVVDYRMESYGEFAGERRNPGDREELVPNTVGYALMEAACSGRGQGPRSWSERDFVEAFRRDWTAQNYSNSPPYGVGDLAPPCSTRSWDCEVWEREWRGRGLAEGVTVAPSGRIMAN
ncbi:hypothetical protein Q0812_04365 [Brevundimonas sp. 2R-24]|uniref:Uncharacterized protein n=1 Tax=Peiella sedimenti TaxID=3061083 RepID=A0ABT8SJU4_9CAUL|nr:hypothetical protein [Caulobacteraceae bacterium XZ-24]